MGDVYIIIIIRVPTYIYAVNDALSKKHVYRNLFILQYYIFKIITFVYINRRRRKVFEIAFIIYTVNAVILAEIKKLKSHFFYNRYELLYSC